MANNIAPQIIPAWAVTALGMEVRFVKDYDFYGNGSDVYFAGKIGVLNGIQCGTEDGVEALVICDGDDGIFLNPTFDYLQLV